jgi:glycosyltransferase involved in cell wall biosynthesis
MRILFYIHSLSFGGAERVTSTLANYWCRKGWDVTVVTVTGLDRDFYVLEERVERIALDLDANSTNLWQALFGNMRRILALRQILKQVRPNQTLAMMATANVTLALAALGLRVVTVGSERIHPPTMPLGRVWESVRRWFYPRLSGMVAQTKQSADWLELNAPAAKITVIPNPLNYPLPVKDPKLAPSAIREETGCSHLLLAVGRLSQQKRFDRLLNVFAAASKGQTEWALVILGEGEQRDLLEAQVRSLGIGRCVRLPGAVGNVGEWYEAADAYVMTSQFEGFPNTLVEALAYGLPSVAVDCETGPREILRHEVDGLLVPQDDPDALTYALCRLMGDQALRGRFANRAVEARERFAVDRVAVQWENFFSLCRDGNVSNSFSS